MSVIEKMGTMDGKPAKVRIIPERGQTHIFWGGMFKPDGPGHNHITIQHSNPDEIHFMRENGRIVVNKNADGQRRINAANGIADILGHAWRQNKRYWRWVNRNSPW